MRFQVSKSNTMNSKRAKNRGLKGLSSVWGPALPPSVIAILFSLKDSEKCKLPSAWPVAQLSTCPAQPLFRMGKFPNEDRFHRGLFVAPNRTDHQTPGSVKVLQLDAGSTFSLPDLATAFHGFFRKWKLEENPSIQWFQCGAKIGGNFGIVDSF